MNQAVNAEDLANAGKTIKRLFYVQFVVALIATYWIVDGQNYLNFNLAPASIKSSVKADLQTCLPVVDLNLYLADSSSDIAFAYKDFIDKYETLIQDAANKYNGMEVKPPAYSSLNSDNGLSGLSLNLTLHGANTDYSNLPLENLESFARTYIKQEKINNDLARSQIKLARNLLNANGQQITETDLPEAFDFTSFVAAIKKNNTIRVKIKKCPDIGKLSEAIIKLNRFANENNILQKTYAGIYQFVTGENLNIAKTVDLEKVDVGIIPVQVEKSIILIFLPLFFVYNTFMLLSHVRNRLFIKKLIAASEPENNPTKEHYWLLTNIERLQDLKITIVEKIVLNAIYYLGLFLPMFYQGMLFIYIVNRGIPKVFLALNIFCIILNTIALILYFRLYAGYNKKLK